MWRRMTVEQVFAWMNTGWSPDVREVGVSDYEYWDSSHVHVVDREECSAPDFHGSFTVTQWCECGLSLGTVTDSIL